jgi:hypothetical protein
MKRKRGWRSRRSSSSSSKRRRRRVITPLTSTSCQRQRSLWHGCASLSGCNSRRSSCSTHVYHPA